MNSYGTLFRITLYGESHQSSIGVIVDGMPAGILINENAIQILQKIAVRLHHLGFIHRPGSHRLFGRQDEKMDRRRSFVL